MEQGGSTGRSFDIREIFGIFLKRKWLIIIPLIVSSGVTFGVIETLEPRYKASNIIWMDKPSSVSRELINIIGTGRRENAQEQRQSLRALQNEITSQTYLAQLILAMHLDEVPWVVAVANNLRQNNPEQSIEMLKQQLLLTRLRSQIQVLIVATDQIMIVAESNDPVEARDIVTHLARILEEEKTKYEMDKIIDNQDFADRQLERMQYDYQQALDSLTAAQSRLTELGMEGNVPTESNRRELVTAIDKADQDAMEFQSRKETAGVELAQSGLNRPKIKYSSLMSQRRSDIDDKIATLVDLIEDNAVDDVEVVNTNIRISNSLNLVEQEMAVLVDQQFSDQPDDIRLILSTYFYMNESVDILNTKRNRLATALQEMTARIDQLPRLQVQIDEWERRVQMALRYRDVFKNEEVMVKIRTEQARNRTRYKVIEPASIPLTPFWPDKNQLGILGLVLGLMIGGAAAVIAEILDNSFKRVEDVEEVLGLKVIAVVPKIEKLKTR